MQTKKAKADSIKYEAKCPLQWLLFSREMFGIRLGLIYVCNPVNFLLPNLFQQWKIVHLLALLPSNMKN